jgi:hypothetical protein|tara:strand:- start:60 stop:287 length:228 start_codon:yes stop_codon:yes gene_type:complete
MLDKFNHIRKLSGLYDVAIENQNNEIRLHTADVGLVLSDINKLLSLVVNGQLDRQEVELVQSIAVNEGTADAGRF